MLGAIGPDHKNLRMTMEDSHRYFTLENKKIAKRWKVKP
jgi:hypothetical protein